eukprot:2694135-Pyramimonas_sp.AAC.1
MVSSSPASSSVGPTSSAPTRPPPSWPRRSARRHPRGIAWVRVSGDRRGCQRGRARARCVPVGAIHRDLIQDVRR